MKKALFIIIAVFILTNLTTSDVIRIPDDALRFRVIANSDSKLDQQIKIEVKDNLEQDIYNYLKDAKNSDEAKKIIANNIGSINNTIDQILKKHSTDYTYHTSLGKNHFPTKEYKGVIYEEGEYDSLVVTLGSGEGCNWWCVLFPPLCLLEAEENETNEVEYQFFVKELIDKYSN